VRSEPASARILKGYLIAASALGPGYLAVFGLMGGYWSASIALFFGLATLLGWRTYAKGHFQLTSTILVAGIFIAPAWVTLFTSGASSPAVIWLTPAPFIASTMLGRHAALLVGTLAACWVALLGIVGVDALPQEMTEPFVRQLLTVVAAVTAIALVTFYGWVTAKEYEGAQRALAQEHQALLASSEQLDARNRAMRLVFDHVDQGFLTISADGKIGPERSRILDAWFGTPPPGQTLQALISEHDPVAGHTLALGLDDLRAGIMPAELIIDQLPKAMTAHGRNYALEYRQIGSTEAGGLMVVLSDRTETHRARAAEQRNHELVEVLRLGTADPAGIATFLAESDRLVQELLRHEGGDELMRALHTLKGNAAVFGLLSFASQIHDRETELAEIGSLALSRREAIADAWRHERERIASLGLGDNDRVHIRCSELRDLKALATSSRDGASVARAVESLCAVAVKPRLDNLGRQALSMAERMQKRVSVTVEDHGVRLPMHAYDGVWSSLAHVVRNAVDHGLETPDERVSAGKTSVGQLRLSARMRDDEISISIEDDGRGIDWARVKSKAEQLGIAVTGDASLVDALFSDGLSTRDEVTALSGRGVGTSVVALAVREHGGRIEVDSTPRTGTRFTLHLPLATDSFKRSA